MTINTDQHDDEWTGDRVWELVEARLNEAMFDALVETSTVIQQLRRDHQAGQRLRGRLRKRVINGAYANDFGYWRQGANAMTFMILDDIEEEIMDAIVYMAIKRWIEDERSLEDLRNRNADAE